MNIIAEEEEEERTRILSYFNARNRAGVEEVVDGCLPLGYRFHPSDYEVIQPYLLSRIFGTSPSPFRRQKPIKDVDMSTFDPNDIVFDEECMPNEAYFYVGLQHEGVKGILQRVTTVPSGFNMPIYSDNGMQVVVGFKRNWELHCGQGIKRIAWLMTEYRVNPRFFPADQINEDIKTNILNYAVCRFKKL